MTLRASDQSVIKLAPLEAKLRVIRRVHEVKASVDANFTYVAQFMSVKCASEAEQVAGICRSVDALLGGPTTSSGRRTPLWEN
jgi:hypothetical protein